MPQAEVHHVEDEEPRGLSLCESLARITWTQPMGKTEAKVFQNQLAQATSWAALNLL